MALQGKKFAGDLLVRAFGSQDAFQKIGNVTELTTKRDVETDELVSTGRADYGEAISVQVKAKPTEINIKFNSFDKAALARALMGSATELATGKQTIAETTVKASLGGWIKLSHMDIDPDNFTLKNKSDVPIDKDKYELRATVGMIRLLETSGVNEGDNIKYSGKTKGSAGYQIEANTLQSLPLEMVLDGYDLISDRAGVLEIAHAVLSSDSDINWFSDDWWEAGLSGKIVKDEGKPAMRFVEYH